MENNTFSPSRFGKYFTHDLFTARSNYGVSFLLLALLPVIVALLSNLFRLIFSHFVDVGPHSTSIAVAAGAFVAAILSFPSKVYGGITSKSYGSDWVLLPASSLEKFLSMMLMELIVLPVVFIAVMLGSDAIFTLFIPGGESLVSRFSDASVSVSAGKGLFGIWLVWCINTLIFTLGALCFKKNKVALTILVTWAVSTVLTFILALTVGNISINSVEDLAEKFATSEADFETWLKWLASVITVLLAGGLMTGIFFRIKRIKF